ncbi:MAG: porphobilinogen synthase [Candidatus Hydrogenedentota bacterium]|nr:MAG: porphobilinogen synthase [Candidatus Hydrogenedentota bacterium]
MAVGMFPNRRLRRMRETPAIREMCADITLTPNRFIQPIFVHAGEQDEEISSMPEIKRISINNIRVEIEKIRDAGIKGILLFPLPYEKSKTEDGRIAHEEGEVLEIIRQTKEAAQDLVLFTDLCLCPFTTHGHCGILDGKGINNDATLEALGKTAVAFARAGTDFVAPSGMMDGMVKAIRQSLDSDNYPNVGILSYSIKFASHFYGPFRDAAHSAPEFGDRKSYQMDFRNSHQIFEELVQDIAEGADATMVKPGLPYLDVISKIRSKCMLPIAVYQVSGEYSSLMLAAKQGILQERQAFEETFYSFFRAGADWIISYYAVKYFSGS